MEKDDDGRCRGSNGGVFGRPMYISHQKQYRSGHAKGIIFIFVTSARYGYVLYGFREGFGVLMALKALQKWTWGSIIFIFFTSAGHGNVLYGFR